MTLTTNKRYQAFGFTIESEIALPELVQSIDEKNVDIKITQDEPSEHVALQERPYEHVVDGETVRFYIPTVGCFSVHAGRIITVAPHFEVDEGLIRLYVLGTCMGIILMQHHYVPLHGSAVVIQDKVYAFIGESGAGKSTLASTFLQKGYALISDDVIAVSSQNGIPVVTPSYPQQKMWKDSLGYLGVDETGYTPIFDREDKYSIPVLNYCTEKLPLAGIFELTVTTDEVVRIEPVQTLEKFQLLYAHTYRNFLIERLGQMPHHFQMSSQLAIATKMYKLKRPEAIFSAPELVQCIIDKIEEEEIR